MGQWDLQSCSNRITKKIRKHDSTIGITNSFDWNSLVYHLRVLNNPIIAIRVLIDVYNG